MNAMIVFARPFATRPMPCRCAGGGGMAVMARGTPDHREIA
ncbi:hypothetical protein [Xanthomonas sp. GPE 39]|nr:hypothetical protein [Xanthomonas sp. GPE 39]